MFIIKNTETALNNGMMAAKLESMLGKKDDKFYDHAVSKLGKMEKIGQLESFNICGKTVIVIKIS